MFRRTVLSPFNFSRNKETSALTKVQWSFHQNTPVGEILQMIHWILKFTTSRLLFARACSLSSQVMHTGWQDFPITPEKTANLSYILSRDSEFEISFTCKAKYKKIKLAQKKLVQWTEMELVRFYLSKKWTVRSM